MVLYYVKLADYTVHVSYYQVSHTVTYKKCVHTWIYIRKGMDGQNAYTYYSLG